MQIEGFYPDAITFLLILKVCGIMRDVEKGKQIHGQIVNKGMLKNNIVLGNALVDMYAKFGLLTKAQRVFEELPVRDVSSWNSLITGYAHGGLSHEAFSCFEGMQSEGISPNSITFVCILKACGSIGTIHKGKWIHDEAVKMGLIESNNVILGNALVDMYTKCNHIAKAAQVLERLPNSDVVTWSTLIAWYAQQGQGHEALTCFKGMQQRGICPNEVTFICILKACASIGAIEKGIEIHNKIACQGLLDKDIILGNALVDMYTKCGLLGKAKQVLESLPIRNAVSWNTLIAGYAQRGQGYEATKCFMEMQKEGLSPNEVTFLSILRSCSHSGLLKESECFLRNMGIEYGISPNSEHFTCMVSVLGCAGHFEEAISVIDVMSSPCDEELATWLSLLGSCSKWGNIALGKLAFARAIEIDKGAGAAYTLMGTIFASFGLRKDAEKVEAMRLKYAVHDVYSEKLPFSSFVAG
jgi:pentatricopeptide repeat protein